MKRVLLAMIAAAAVSMVASAQAATVSYKLVVNQGDHTFNLFASDSIGDNYGISLFGVPLTGGITSITNVSPYGQFAVGGLGSGPIGFSEIRSASNVNTVTGAQSVVPTPTPYLVRGFGQTSGSLTAGGVSIFGSSAQTSYGAPLLLATGTYAGTLPGFNTSSPDLLAQVFTAATGSAIAFASVNTQVVVPEPGTLALAGLGLLGLCLVARKRISQFA